MKPAGTSFMLQPEDTIGSYRVIRPLGAGGMGEVYLVEHAHLRKRYALKILPPDVSADVAFIDRFRIEARVMADLEHPGIVRVHNFGEDHGRHFLVMDYVEGPDGSPRTLEDELAWGNKLPEQAVLNMAVQLCDALEYAHTFPQGAIIHRDLKPGNILIQKAGHTSSMGGGRSVLAGTDDRRIKIADFGLAKIVGTDYIRAVIDRSTTLTAMQVRPAKSEDMATMVNSTPGSSAPLLGTYDYMSPEQKTGAAVDARSDLYALGLILYRMLTGHRPEGAYDPPSKLGFRKRWDPIIAKCLQREIDKRYQSAAQMRADLLALAAPAHQRPLVQRIAIAAVLVLAAAGIYLLGSRAAPPAAPDHDEILPLASALGDKQLAPLELNVEPTGAVLRISRGKDVIAEAVIGRTKGMKIRLKPDRYTFQLTHPGYRTIVQEVPVGPESASSWTVAMIEAFGYLHTRQPESDQITIRPVSGLPFTPAPPQRQGLDLVYRLPIDRYQIDVTRAHHQPFTFTADIRENEPVTLVATLQPRPGSLLLNGPDDLEIWEKNRLLGRAGERIAELAAGPHELELRRPGYRSTPLAIDIGPESALVLDAPALEQQAATLRVAVSVSGDVAVPADAAPTRARITIGSRAPQEIELPWSGELRDLGAPIPLALEVPGYTTTQPQPITLRDREDRTVTVRVKPLPVTVIIDSQPPATIFRVRAAGSGLKKLLGVRDQQLGRSGEPFTLDPFTAYTLSVVADGHQPATLDFPASPPGTTNTVFRVTLPPATEPGL
ncbi:MAG TPA: serine/threonine-protein kinase [Kiritimatiellia bacterium]|nr:serine/threonine-protein kinase [Kiritimatiellia bacterium]HMP33975.1 serine/threonine-protein kinase [Kiritimatiellia bacterium]